MLNLVTNTYKNFIMNARIRKSLRKWAADEAFIRLKLGGKKYSSGARFTWCVLIPQEIAAWIIRGDKTAPKREFEWLCARRGFNSDQREYLKGMMIHVGMWK